jgi:hypothetical protein
VDELVFSMVAGGLEIEEFVGLGLAEGEFEEQGRFGILLAHCLI